MSLKRWIGSSKAISAAMCLSRSALSALPLSTHCPTWSPRWRSLGLGAWRQRPVRESRQRSTSRDDACDRSLGRVEWTSRQTHMSIHSLVPDAEALLELEPEELAGVLMEHRNSLPDSVQRSLSRYNFSLPDTVREYPREHQDALMEALMEAWVWLEREGLLVPQPGAERDWVFISRRGRQLRTRDQVHSYRVENLLPRKQLHARIAQKVWASFLRGDYDTAVFRHSRRSKSASGRRRIVETQTSESA